MLKRIWLLPLVALILTACGTTDQTSGGKGGDGMQAELSVAVDDLTKGEGFIIRIEDDKVLVNDTFFTIDEKTHLVSLGNKEEKLSIEDLQPGMKVDAYHSGMMLKSFPAQGYANVFVVKKDQQSLEQSKAFESFLEKENRPNMVLMGEVEYDKETVSFNFTDMNDGLSYRVLLNIADQTYSIEPHTQ